MPVVLTLSVERTGISVKASVEHQVIMRYIWYGKNSDKNYIKYSWNEPIFCYSNE